MSVIVLDPRRPTLIPIEAIPLVRGTVMFTDDVPAQTRAAFAALPDRASDSTEVTLVALDPDHGVVKARRLRGETVVVAATLPGDALVDAVDVMDRLWGFGGWEVMQTHESLRRYLLEETYELLDAIQRGEPDGVREELGDLLLQVLFHARIAQESHDPFDVDDVADTLVAKLARRSPHLTNGHRGPLDPGDQERAWQASKAADAGRDSCLDGIATTQPALALADQIVGRATRAGLPPNLVPHALRSVRIDGTGEAEDRLRQATLSFARDVRATELAARSAGFPSGPLPAEVWARHWVG